MPELLIELGCEELPAAFVRDSIAQFAAHVTHGLAQASIAHGAVTTMGTPRRLIVSIQDVMDRQPDTTQEVRGPGVKAAYQADGSPSPALQGFCRGQGVEPATVEAKGDYVWITKHVAGKATAELLREIIPASIRAMTFPKSMRWGSARMRFARPIRWILAAYAHNVVQFEIETVKSGLESCGHRFYSPGAFEATTLTGLVTELRARKVEPDPAVREDIIRKGAADVAGGLAELSDELVEENVFLTEWPTPIAGTFRDSFLGLPDSVLITAMAKHEKSFPVRDAGGKLTNRFVSVRNSGVDDVVANGYAWVLNARFNDAQFFYDEDAKVSLDEFLARTERMMFQEVLGNVRQRADRLGDLTAAIAERLGATNLDDARAAGLYAKADLSSGLVSELASLQGIIGGEYARRAGKSSVACHAIATQYNCDANMPAESEAEIVGLALCVADQIDKLAGYLGIGLVPSGSSDPYGLRRAANIVIEAALPGSSRDLFEIAGDAYAKQGLPHDRAKMLEALPAILRARYEIAFEEIRYDIVEAAMPEGLDDLLNPRLVAARVESLCSLAQDAAFIQAATRPLNIVAAARKKNEAIPNAVIEADLESSEGKALLTAARGVKPLHDEDEVDDAIAALRSLQAPIDAFFDSTMVMVEDARVRGARLAMLSELSDLIRSFGDVTKIVIAG